MSQDQRSSPRIPVKYPVPVTDRADDSIIGNLVNVSAEGLMLMTSQSLPINNVYQLEMTLSYDDDQTKTIQFGAESLWSQETSTPGHEWVGFHIIDISDEDQAFLDQVVAS